MLTAPWIRVAATHIPSWDSAFISYLLDAKPFVWVIGWVAHALGTAPARMFDANIFHPLPGQLTGGDTLLSSQLVAAPIYWTTGNALLATNAVALLSYPLAAFAMQRLVRGLGTQPASAWVAGLAFALGPLRVPANLQLLQYLNLYLAFVALAIERLRARPTPGRVAVLALALSLAATSSFYLAVIAAVAAIVWTAVATATAPHRLRVLGAAGAAALLAGIVVVAVSFPHFNRPDAAFKATMVRDMMYAMYATHWQMVRDELPGLIGAVPLALALAALVVGWRHTARLTACGLVLAVVGVAFMLGPMQPIGGVEVPLPFTLLMLPGVGVVRWPWRFGVLVGFGVALLLAATVDAAGRRFGRAVPLAVALALVATQGWALFRSPLAPVPALATDRAIYEAVRDATASEDGAILELPTTRGGIEDELVGDHMIASTLHHRPMVLGYTAYPPPERHARFSVLTRLPDVAALHALVATARLRWVLLAPRERWVNPKLRDAIAAAPGLEPLLERDGWTLARVTPPAQ